jgi:hypothetical protein
MTTGITVTAVGIIVAAAIGISTWRFSGPRLRVESKASTDAPSIPAAGSSLHVSITVPNDGRAAATVTGRGFTLPNSRHLEPQALSYGDQVPCRLEGKSSATFLMRKGPLVHDAQFAGYTLSQLKPYVDVNGQKTVSRFRLA